MSLGEESRVEKCKILYVSLWSPTNMHKSFVHQEQSQLQSAVVGVVGS